MRGGFFIFIFLFAINFSKAQVVASTFITGLDIPVSMAIAPDGRFFITCKGYDTLFPAIVKVYDATGTLVNDLWDFSDSTETLGEKGVLGITLDPNFATNHFVYVLYNHKSPAKIRIIRFTEVGSVGTSPFTVLELPDTYVANYHTGGNIHFRPSDTSNIYVSIGDKGVSANGQDSSVWAAKILRVSKDGSIPVTNPFYDDGNVLTGNDDRIWALGLRNSFDFCFNGLNDSLYATEDGVSTYDEVNLIKKGANYGWPNCEGIAPYLGSCAGFEIPLETFGVVVPALTGICFYTSPVMPTLTNHLLVADYNVANIYDLVLGNAPFYDTLLSRTVLSNGDFTNISDIEQGIDGCVYVCEINAGKISKFCSVVGIEEEVSSIGFRVFPNPVSDKITVQGKNVKQLMLFSEEGKILLQVFGNQMSISNFENGIYILRVNESYYTKIIKQG